MPRRSTPTATWPAISAVGARITVTPLGTRAAVVAGTVAVVKAAIPTTATRRATRWSYAASAIYARFGVPNPIRSVRVLIAESYLLRRRIIIMAGAGEAAVRQPHAHTTIRRLRRRGCTAAPWPAVDTVAAQRAGSVIGSRAAIITITVAAVLTVTPARDPTPTRRCW